MRQEMAPHTHASPGSEGLPFLTGASWDRRTLKVGCGWRLDRNYFVAPVGESERCLRGNSEESLVCVPVAKGVSADLWGPL